MRKWILGAIFIGLLAGCSTNPQESAPIEDRTPTAVNAGAGSGATTGGATGGGVSGSATGSGAGTTPGGAGAGVGAGAGAAALRDPNNILSKRSVYFDYDSDAVKDEYRSLIEAHARYLQQNRNTRITLQGNTDERGSREYNIALGQRRADAVRQLMRVLGASDAQIETVSFGEEKPKNPGHDESAWAANRRADIVYQGE
ncbi:MAG: peptidoglycan-associated lipoprotein Pal [Casimicrobiaceae bacterium]